MSKTLQRLDTLQEDRSNDANGEKEASKDPIISKLGMVLWLVASISATVFSYHLGIHQGIQTAKNESPRQWLYYFNEAVEKKAAVTDAAPLKTEPPAVAIPAAEIPEAILAPEVKAEEDRQESGFTIQVVTYKSANLADKEVERLKQKGHKAFSVKSGDFYQVCIELFNDRKLAMKKLIQLRTEKYYETYPGAYVKFLKQS